MINIYESLKSFEKAGYDFNNMTNEELRLLQQLGRYLSVGCEFLLDQRAMENEKKETIQ